MIIMMMMTMTKRMTMMIRENHKDAAVDNSSDDHEGRSTYY